MFKNLLFLLLVFSVAITEAQTIERVMVQGKIHVPAGEDAEGISVYNASAQKGTITDHTGAFEIEVAEHDRLRVFALQYQPFTAVVDQGIIERKQLSIYVNPAVTQLDEVVVRPYDLTGRIRADVKKIPTYYVDNNWNLSYAAMEFDYGFIVDRQTAIEGNLAENDLNPYYIRNGVDVLAIMGGVAQLLFPKQQKAVVKHKQIEKKTLVSNNLQQRFSRQFVYDNFGIPENRAVDFLDYVQQQGFSDDLLQAENELKLMQFLQETSETYRNNEE